MRNALVKRLAALEPRPTIIDVPHVVTVANKENAADALARFRTEYVGKIAARHGVIILPARIETEDEADFALRFEAQQTALVAAAKSPPQKKDEFNG